MLGKHEEALADALKVCDLRPDSAKAFFIVGMTHLQLKHLNEAREVFHRAITIDPNYQDAKKMLSDVEIQCAVRNGLERKVQGYSDDFECVLCMKLFYNPVTTPCGHTFCRTCLRRALDHSSQCPLCRSILHITAEHPVNVTLKSIIEKNFLAEYKQRSVEASAESQQSEAAMPLFVLNAVVFPRMKFPMHIFEPRYRLMLRRCLEGDKKFGLVNCYRNNGRWVPADVGCILQILDHQLAPDGRSYIDSVGIRRFRVLDRWEQDGYLCGKIEYIDDEPLDSDEKRRAFAELTATTRALLSMLLSSACGVMSAGLQQLLSRAGDIPSGDTEFGFWLAANMVLLLPRDDAMRQGLLELTSPSERMRRLHDILRNLVPNPQADMTRAAADCNVQ